MSRLKPRPTNLPGPSRSHLALLTSSILVLGLVARVFSRGDFLRHWQSNPRPGQTGTSYNFGAAWRAKSPATNEGYQQSQIASGNLPMLEGCAATWSRRTYSCGLATASDRR